MSTPLHQPVNPSNALVWRGESGRTYELQNYPIGTRFNAVGGVYIFCWQASDSRWYAVYVGETDNLSRRLSDELAAHHQLDNVRRAGATHISAMVVSGGLSARLEIETDLRRHQKPPCNQQ
jgi:hypothetical protein